jgi:uncharacterized membrane protein
MAALTILLIIAVCVLWSRVTSLQDKLHQLERALQAALREGKMERPPVEPKPMARPVVQDFDWERPRETQAPALQPTAPPRPASSQHAATSAPRVEPEPELAVVRLIREYFTGGNLIVRVGIIVLFFGVAFLLKYAAEHTQVSIQVRLAGVGVGAVVLFVLGWRLRESRRGFALALQGGSIGVLYLTLFAALRLYQLLSPDLTFLLMAALGVASSLLAVRQDSMAMSFLGAAGGFLAPVLASTGQGSHVVLFSYYALLDLGIVAQAWFKAWRPLNLLAFVFTFGVGTAWGVLRYHPSQFASTEPFLIFFFLAFIAISVLFALRRAPQLTHYVDGTLVFGTPLVAMAMQMELVRDIPDGRAMSAIGAGVVYLALAFSLHRTRHDTVRLLKESFVALGVTFLTLAVPLLLADSWTAITWALEGAALVWVGLRQERWLSIAGGVLLQLGAAVTFIMQLDLRAALVPVANAPFMCALFLAIGGLISARFAAQPGLLTRRFGSMPGHLFLVWGLGWWLFAGVHELQQFMPADRLPGTVLIFCAATALACGLLAKPLSWPALRAPALLILPVMMAAVSWWFTSFHNPTAQAGWLAWPIAYLALWGSLWVNETDIDARLRAAMHGLALWMLSLLLSWEFGWQVSQFTTGIAWAGAVWGLVPAAMLAVSTSAAARQWWPIRNHPQAIGSWVAMGFAAVIGFWSLWLNFGSDGTDAPLPYLPLANPLDVAVGISLTVVASWLTRLWNARGKIVPVEAQQLMIAMLIGVVFVWLNAILLRTLHHWRGVPYELDELLADTAVHTALSIFWTILALGAMLWANRSLRRLVWFCGAALMAVVVIKLFLVDLASIGTVPRIVSFLVVGGLMLVIGYFSPLPPAQVVRQEAR